MGIEVKICEKTLKNPIIMASGTYGFGEEYKRFYDPSILGGISSKGLTLNAKPGNKGIRIWETPSGIMNSIGLENPGVKHFVEEIAPKMNQLGTKVFVNLGGNSLEEYLEATEMLNDIEMDFLELNISCPNVKEGGMAFGLRCEDAGFITGEVKKRTKHPLIVKLSPNGDAISELAKHCEAEGADGISLVNTFQALAVDVRKKEFVFDNITAGLSGPAIFPIALRMVREAAGAVKIPIIGMGGIQSVEDVLAMLMVGASAVQIGTMNFSRPRIGEELIQGLEEYVKKEKLKSIEEIVGIL